MINRLSLLFVIALSAFAAGSYTVERKSSLTAAAEVITVQLPAGTQRSARFISASVYCSAQCEITLERDGALATTTALTPTKLNSTDGTVTAAAFRSSNVGAGTTIGRQIIGAGQMIVCVLQDIGLRAGETFTMRTDSITATVIINIQWQEY